jgi:DNA-binding transcriptional LysR family regulator
VSDSDIVEETLTQEAVVLALPTEHHLAGCAHVRLSDLGGDQIIAVPRSASPDVYERQVTLFRQAGVEAQLDTEQSDHPASVLILVAAGLGVALITPSIARHYNQPGIITRPIRPEPPPIPLSLAWRAHDTNPHLATVIDALRRQSRIVPLLVV